MRKTGMKVRGLAGLLALALLAPLLLAACGRPGPIRAPGPPEEISYPRSYPSR